MLRGAAAIRPAVHRGASAAAFPAPTTESARAALLALGGSSSGGNQPAQLLVNMLRLSEGSTALSEGGEPQGPVLTPLAAMTAPSALAPNRHLSQRARRERVTAEAEFGAALPSGDSEEEVFHTPSSGNTPERQRPVSRGAAAEPLPSDLEFRVGAPVTAETPTFMARQRALTPLQMPQPRSLLMDAPADIAAETAAGPSTAPRVESERPPAASNAAAATVRTAPLTAAAGTAALLAALRRMERGGGGVSQTAADAAAQHASYLNATHAPHQGGAAPVTAQQVLSSLGVNMLQRGTPIRGGGDETVPWAQIAGSRHRLAGRTPQDIAAWCTAANVYLADAPPLQDPIPSLFLEQMRWRIAPATQAMMKFDELSPAMLEAAMQVTARGDPPRVACSAMIEVFQRGLSRLMLNTVNDREQAFKRFTHIDPSTGRVFEYPDALMAALIRAKEGTQRISTADAVVLAVWCLNMMGPAFSHSFAGPQAALGYATRTAYCDGRPLEQWDLGEFSVVANRLFAARQELQQTNTYPPDHDTLPGQGPGKHPYDAWHPPSRQPQYRVKAPYRNSVSAINEQQTTAATVTAPSPTPPSGRQRTCTCSICGGPHVDEECWTEQPRMAPTEWPGPSTKPLYQRWLRNRRAQGMSDRPTWEERLRMYPPEGAASDSAGTSRGRRDRDFRMPKSFEPSGQSSRPGAQSGGGPARQA